MKHTLDRALEQILGPLTGLRAVALSVAPDGLIAWSWSRDGRHEIALGFAALDRAATVCLEGLGASQESRSLLLAAKDAWVAAWPLYDSALPVDALDGVDGVEAGAKLGRQRVVVTTVFSGELQSGMVMVYGARIRLRLRAALDAARDHECATLRERLVGRVLDAEDPAAELRDLAARSDIDLRRLASLDQLSPEQRERLLGQTGPRMHIH